MSEVKTLERRALRVMQNDQFALYLFTLRASEISDVADVARISRDEAGRLIGYQRPERRQHVKQIADYLDGSDVLFPNGLILAFSEPLRFKASRGPGSSDGLSTAGVVEIDLPTGDGPRPAWIVDGQQRSLALAQTRNTQLPIPIAGFVAPSIEVQRDQFLRVNTVSPLPVNLVTELLPEVPLAPSPKMSARRLPSALVDMLNQHPGSPFLGLVRRSSTPRDRLKGAVVTDNSLVEALKESLESPSGTLFAYRNIATGTADTETMQRILFAYWSAVRASFPDAWGKPATRSRLMGGVGIRSMSRLMDRIVPHVDVSGDAVEEGFRTEVARITGICRWTAGTWEGLGLPWNEVQNTPRHISGLSNLLVRSYVESRAGNR